MHRHRRRPEIGDQGRRATVTATAMVKAVGLDRSTTSQGKGRGRGGPRAKGIVAVASGAGVVVNPRPGSSVSSVIIYPSFFGVRRPAFVLRACSGSAGHHRLAQFEFRILKIKMKKVFIFAFVGQ